MLDDPASFKTKEESKLSVLEYILQPDLYPQLYGNIYHKVKINYYPPRGDNKEGWDNIDIFGWLGYPMQIKVDFLCRDSILAAPIVLDLVLLLDLAQRTSSLEGTGNPGMAELLLQVADDCAGTLSGARSVHPVDEAEEHAAPPEGRGTDYPPRPGILRLRTRFATRQIMQPCLPQWEAGLCFRNSNKPAPRIQLGVKYLLLAALICASTVVFAVSGTFRGVLVQDPVSQDAHKWIYLGSPNGSVRRVEISRAEVAFGEDVGRASQHVSPTEALKKGAGLRVTASQDESGEWAATRIEIIEMPPK